MITRLRAGGVVDLPFPILLLTTTGARTGRKVTSPLGYVVDDGDDPRAVFVVGSKAGSPHHPAWFHNLAKNPDVTVELDSRTYRARAHIADAGERDRLFAVACARNPLYLHHEAETSRVFPVVVLEGVPAPPR